MKATLHLDTKNIISPIDNRIYSSFIEHMGRAVYTGIYEPAHSSADAEGFRQDVADLIRPLNISHIRYPGGNFLSGYDWKDGIGPKKDRPTRPELAWSALEPNQVGTDEFLSYCERMQISPMLGVNLGTGTPKDALELLEYCNSSLPTYWANKRMENGRKEPYGVKLWCLGNEMDGPWQICAKTASEYSRIACETAKLMKMLDPDIELVACGSSFHSMPTFGIWEETVLRECYPYIDYLSLHQYYQDMDGDVMSFLCSDEDMSDFIDEVAAICEKIKKEKNSDKDIKLSFDEWNVWYHFQKAGKNPEKWIVGRPIEEEEFDFADTLLVGSMLNTLINHSDMVKIACLAQLVNCIAPIMTEENGKSWTQTIYWPFLYASKYGRGTALRINAEVPSYTCKLRKEASYLSSSAVLSEDGHTLSLFLINKNPEEEMEIDLPEIKGELLSFVTIAGHSFDTVNTADSQPVFPREVTARCLDDLKLPAASWNMIQIKLS